ncbi:MAG: glycoside hydrolase family 5 protein [Lactobacillaceae bacterium]|nr:glycoside hydrolase family 5 protein [Lactobacillaceae bacterium]
MKKTLICMLTLLMSFGCMVNTCFAVDVEDVPTSITPAVLNKQAPFSKGFNIYLNGHDVRKDLAPNDLRTNIGKIRFIHAIGGDVVRIPIRLISTMNNPQHKIDAQLLSSLHALIDEASKPEYQPMHLVIDNHDGGTSYSNIANSANPLSPHDTLVSLWNQVTDALADTSNKAVFEIQNEPDWERTFTQQQWCDLQAEIVSNIRATDTKHPIIMTQWAKASTDPIRNPFYTREGLANQNVILNVHDYCPSLFTQQGLPSNDMDKINGIEWPYNPANFPLPDGLGRLEYMEGPVLDRDESEPVVHYSVSSQPDYIAQVLNSYVTKANALDAPMFVGEWGSSCGTDLKPSLLKYNKFMTKQFNQRGMAWTAWNLDDYAFSPLDITLHTTDFLYDYDLNKEVVEAMGLHTVALPKMGTDDFVMYDDDVHFTKNYAIWWGEFSPTPYTTRFDTFGKDSLLNIKFTGGNRDVRFQFINDISGVDFVKQGYTIEFDAKLDSNMVVRVGFANNGDGRYNKAVNLVGDQQYHHYSVTLDNLVASNNFDQNHFDNLSFHSGAPDVKDIRYDNIVLKAH